MLGPFLKQGKVVPYQYGTVLGRGHAHAPLLSAEEEQLNIRTPLGAKGMLAQKALLCFNGAFAARRLLKPTPHED